MSGTTNFLQFNPTQANQETDAEYAGDATRTSGALDGNAWPDSSANKTLYQVSTMTAALGQMLANKGFSVSDANYDALVAQLANLLTTIDLRFGLQNLSWSASIVLNAQTFTAFAVPLQGTTALSLTGVVAGQVYAILYSQDTAGAHAVTFGSGFDANATQPDSGPSVLSAQLFLADATLVLRPIGPLISRGGVNGTPIGVGVAAPGRFTTLTLSGGAPAGQVLTGDGTNFVPAAAPGYTSGSSGTGRWEKNPSGRITQWGTGTTTGSGSPQVFSMPIAFSSAAYDLQVTCRYMQSHLINAAPVSSSQFETYSWNMSNDPVSVPFGWSATGY